MKMSDLPLRHQSEIVRQLGQGRPLGMARTEELRAVEVVAYGPQTFSFFAAGNPKGQPRPRAFAMKMGNGKFSARVFDAGTAEGWKSQVAQAAREVTPATAIAGPVRVELGFIFRRPKSHLRSNGEVKAGSPNHHVGKPDGDNLAKAVLDALTQLGGWWHDDAQVAELIVHKSYGPKPGCHVAVRALEDMP